MVLGTYGLGVEVDEGLQAAGRCAASGSVSRGRLRRLLRLAGQWMARHRCAGCLLGEQGDEERRAGAEHCGGVAWAAQACQQASPWPLRGDRLTDEASARGEA